MKKPLERAISIIYDHDHHDYIGANIIITVIGTNLMIIMIVDYTYFSNKGKNVMEVPTHSLSNHTLCLSLCRVNYELLMLML